MHHNLRHVVTDIYFAIHCCNGCMCWLEQHPQCDLEKCVSCGKRGQPALPPKCWGAMDASGKKMGWVQPPRPKHWPDEEERSTHGQVQSDMHLESLADDD